MKKKNLRLTHLEQLELYIDSYNDGGFYYGNKEQFFKRHEDLKAWIADAQTKLLDGKKLTYD